MSKLYKIVQLEDRIRDLKEQADFQEVLLDQINQEITNLQFELDSLNVEEALR